MPPAADVAGRLSLEALHGTLWPSIARIHAVRPHPRQVDCAATCAACWPVNLLARRIDPDVQDAYTLRCIPQVHGACHDAIKYARWVIEIELNSATDNPLIFWDDDGSPIAISGGNFHGEPLAIAIDYLGLAMTELGNISERRLTRLTDGTSNRHVLPDFLTKDGGLNSGFMLTQYTAAALASENKALVHPASVDTIPTSANWEDHVSNGPIAGRQARQIIDNVERILAIELMAAAQGIDFRREVMPAGPAGRGTQAAYDLMRARGRSSNATRSCTRTWMRCRAACGELRRSVQPVDRGTAAGGCNESDDPLRCKASFEGEGDPCPAPSVPHAAPR